MAACDSPSLNLSMPPKQSMKAWQRSLLGLLSQGDRFCQKMEWLMWPPPLKRSVFAREITVLKGAECGESEIGAARAELPEVPLLQGGFRLLLGDVQVVDVGLVMFAVVVAHDVSGDYGFQGFVGVGEVGELVGRADIAGIGVFLEEMLRNNGGADFLDLLEKHSRHNLELKGSLSKSDCTLPLAMPNAGRRTFLPFVS